MLAEIIRLYTRFLNIFPPFLHFWLSLAIFIFLVIWFIDLIKKSWLWLVLLVIFIPASVPLLKHIGETVIGFLGYLLGK